MKNPRVSIDHHNPEEIEDHLSGVTSNKVSAGLLVLDPTHKTQNTEHLSGVRARTHHPNRRSRVRSQGGQRRVEYRPGP